MCSGRGPSVNLKQKAQQDKSRPKALFLEGPHRDQARSQPQAKVASPIRRPEYVVIVSRALLRGSAALRELCLCWR